MIVKTNDIGLIKVGKVVLHAGFLTGVEYNRANIIATKREICEKIEDSTVEIYA